LNHIVQKCEQSDVGARQIAMLLNNTLLPQISEELLALLATDKTFYQVKADITQEGSFEVSLEMKKPRARRKTSKKELVA
jgi:type VI secretion system protein VasG